MCKENQTVYFVLPNTCSIWRWTGAFCLSAITLVLTAQILAFLLSLTPFSSSGSLCFYYEILQLMLPYALAFWVMCLCLKKICHNPVKDFIFGLHGKLNVKILLTLSGLYLLGVLITFYLSGDILHLNEIQPKVILINFILCLLFVWMQTSLEEFWFRGLFIRYVGKGVCGLSIKLILAGCLSSLIFMILHFSNPAFTAQTDLWHRICLALSYFTVGALFYLLDLCFGDLTPGLVLHWLNNMLAFTLISGSNPVSGNNGIFLANGTSSGMQSLIGIILNFFPVFLYVILQAWRKKLPCRQDQPNV